MKHCLFLFGLLALAVADFRELFHASGGDSRQRTIDLLGTHLLTTIVASRIHAVLVIQ